MRSTQKKGADRMHSVSWHLMRRKPAKGGRRVTPTHIAKQFRQIEANSLQIAAMYRAAQTATTTTAVINAMWDNSQLKAHGSAADDIVRAAGFREPPEAEPTTQITPIKPPPKSGGAQACLENPMTSISTEELQRQHHQIATLAAETAGRVASHLQFDPLLKEARLSQHTPAAAGKAVTDAYQAALKQLSEGAASRAAAVATGD